MKVKRFLAASVKVAIAQVKERLGPDAVILSNRATPEGVEVLAIAEADMATMTDPSSAAFERAAPPPGFTSSFRRTEVGVTPAAPSAQARSHAEKVAQAMKIAQAAKAANAARAALAGKPQGDNALAQSPATPPAPVVPPSFARRENQAQARSLEILQREPQGVAAPEVDFAAARAVEPSQAHFIPPNASVRGFSFADLLHRPLAPVVSQKVQVRQLSEQSNFEDSTSTMLRPERAERMERVERNERSERSERTQRIERSPAPTRPSAAAPAGGVDLAGEIRALRGFVESRLSTLGWSDDMRRRPVATTLMRELLAAGFSTTLARAATSAVPEPGDAKEGRAWLQSKLVERLFVSGPSGDIVERGGVFALTGPTGVGKTTTTAKIAARCVVKYGAASLGLITTDTYRIGAHDQLKVFGKILGVQVQAVHDSQSLLQALAEMRGKRLVLIDTIGLGQRDDRVDELLAMLDGAGVSRLLLLAATSQVETLEEVLNAYGTSQSGGNPVGAIVTKLDEAAKLGGIVDVLVRHKLNVQFVGIGQRVPEDLALPDRDELVRAALRVPRGGPFAITKEEATMLAAFANSPNVGANANSSNDFAGANYA